ncbi:MAG: class I SAM-dependent methyltransferase [Acidimicrobiales bacterium]|jgi:SAM-dependent methyltransferase
MGDDDLFKPISTCRICGSADLFPVVDLGRQPLANALLTPSSPPAPTFPLAAVGCPGCSVVQLSGTVDPRAMFDDYLYLSSYSTSMVSAMQRLASETARRLALGRDDLVVEVASNDGYLLRHYQQLGIRVLGIEPAANVAEVARAAGVETRVDYFTPKVATDLRSEGLRPRVIHANNVLAHVPDIHGFVEAMHILLADDGVAIIETPYVVDLIDQCWFETIYHEHVFYYSLTALARLFGEHGMVLQDYEHLEVHGGSLRLTVGSDSRAVPATRITSTLADEAARGLTSARAYARFAADVAASRGEIISQFHDVKGSGRSLAGYGAAAKATVLLNFAGIDASTIDYIADKNPAKQGRIIPGTGIEVVPVERIREDPPDVLAVLIWNLASEVREQLDWFTSAGGELIVPLENRRHRDRGTTDRSAPSHT